MMGFSVLPVAGWGTVSHMLLPALVLGLGTMAYLTRLMRSSMQVLCQLCTIAMEFLPKRWRHLLEVGCKSNSLTRQAVSRTKTGVNFDQ
jgi:hypothetical protein